MRSLFPIILMIITGLNLFAQSSKEIYLRAQESYYSQDYQGSLKKLRTVQSQLNTSNAVIEHLKVKCYFALDEYNKAQESLKEFSKYKAGEPLVQEMAQYQKRIRQKQKKTLLQKLKTRQKESEEDYTEIEGDIEANKRSLEKELEEQKLRMEWEPFAKENYNAITSDLKTISELEEGKYYYFVGDNASSGSKSDISLFCFYDDRYIILRIPEPHDFRRLNKNKVRFRSQDAVKLINDGLAGLYSPKTKTQSGKYPMYFLWTGDSDAFIGGEGDAVLQNPVTQDYNYLELYYCLLDGKLYVATKIGDYFDLKIAKLCDNPSIETGKIEKSINQHILISSYQDSLMEISDFKQLSSTNANKKLSDLLEIKLKPEGKRKVIAPYKEVLYSPTGKLYTNNLSVYQDNKIVDKWKSFQYHTVKSQSTFYSFLETGENYQAKNLLENLYELKSNRGFTMSKSTFNNLFSTFSVNYGTGVKRQFNNSNYTQPMDVFMSLPEDIHSLKESKTVNAAFMSRNYSDNGLLKSEGLKKGDQYIGYWKFYSDQGIKTMEGVYNNNGPHGKWLFYYTETGDYGQTRMYDEGKLMNILENVDPKGHPQDYGTLKDGNGTVKYIDEEGILESVYRYEEGKKISYLYNNGASLYPQNTEKKEVFLVTDKRPSFPGGRQAKIEYIKKNIQYPEEVKKKGIEGFVGVYVIIEKDGSIKNMNVGYSLHPKLDAEALRIIKNMPKWSAGEREGSPVRSLEYIPVWFRL